MGQRELIITYNGKEYVGHVATISRTTLGEEDHGILTTYLMTEWSGGGQGFGGYALDEYDKELKKRIPTAYGLDFIVKVMWAVGVREWESLKGQKVIILHDAEDRYGSIKGLAHITNEDCVFIANEHWETWKDRKN